MGPWRLELLRCWRTRRAIALAATFLILGLGIPVLTYYLPELANGAKDGLQIHIPKQTAHDAIAGFANNVGQLGTLVVVIVAAATMAVDARPGVAAFYRTRLRRPAQLVLPRYVVVTAASIAALALGTFGALFETSVLIGPVSFAALMAGLGLEALWLCFATSIVTLFASAIRGVLGVVGASIVLFLALVLLEGLPSAFSWFPTSLSGSVSDLVQRPAGEIWHAILISGVSGVAALALAVNRFGQRELYTSATRRPRGQRRRPGTAKAPSSGESRGP